VARAIVVIGGGVAGLAAAWAAARLGARVTVVDDGIGASALGGGAIDETGWERIAAAGRVLGQRLLAPAVDADVDGFVRALGLWTLARQTAPVPRLVTMAGRIRPARGHDRALLDVSDLEGRTVVIPRLARPGWDADALAAMLADDPFAREGQIAFEAIDASVLRHEDERRAADGDLALYHDRPERLDWLGDRLRDALRRGNGRAGAVLLGPWLGATAPRAAALTERIGVKVGEALVGVGGPAGLRYEAARARLLESIGATFVVDRAAAVRANRRGVTVRLERGEALSADAAVVAVGGMAGGGIVYAPPEHAAGFDLPVHGAVPFHLSVDAQLELGLGDGAMGPVSSLHGPDFDATAWPVGNRSGALELVGVRAPSDPTGRVIPAGDVVAGRPRTILTALASGLSAGRSAATA
jgi:glycerol-3-phosphate dehydrogenase subunit B